MSLPIYSFCAVFLFSMSSQLASAADWYVDDNAPGDPGPQNPLVSDPLEDGSPAHPFDRIQEAIDAAATSNSIEVEPGTYFEFGTINLGSKNLVITAQFNAQSTIIDMVNWNDQVMEIAGNQDSTTVITGFTFRNGRALGVTPNDRGAGLRCNNTSPVIRNCKFVDGQAIFGGGAYANGGSPVFENCEFTNNIGTTSGGAAYMNAANSTFTYCAFIGNMATAETGGGVRLASGTSDFSGCLFDDNQSKTFGGGIHIDASAVVTISGSSFKNNFSGDGGTNGRGGAIDTTGTSNTTMTNCILFNNSATRFGGALYAGVTTQVRNCTIVGNTTDTATNGAVGNTAATLRNCIAWGNGAAPIAASNSVQYSDVDGGYTGAGNISSDPLFYSITLNLHLQPTSPCIDAGDSSVLPLSVAEDFGAQPRVVNGLESGATGVPAFGYYIDMGAYEFQPEILPDTCPADIAPAGGDQLVNVSDLLAVINAWGACD